MQQVLKSQTRQLFEQPRLVGKFAVKEMAVKEGTISPQTAISKARFEDVLILRVYGEHRVEFPREGIKILEPVIESYSVEKLLENQPQILELDGKLMPEYPVRDLSIVPLGRTAIRSIATILYPLEPISFRAWAEYISPEEKMLNATKQKYLAVSQTKLIAIPVRSPSVALTFADGRTDIDTGAQVVEYRGTVFPKSSLPVTGRPRLELTHVGGGGGGDRRVQLDKFTASGVIEIKGYGRLYAPCNGLSQDGGLFRGTAHYDKGFVLLFA